MARHHRKKRLEAKFGKRDKKVSLTPQPTQQETVEKKKSSSGSFFDSHYKKLLIIPFAVLFISFIVLGVHFAQTGDFINKGISLKGGTAITITSDMADLSAVDTQALKEGINAAFTQMDVSVRTQRQFQQITSIEIEVSSTDAAEIDQLKTTLTQLIDGLDSNEAGKNIRTSGSSLGQAFFSQIIKALIVAFILMGIVVFIQFRVPIPSLAVMLAAFSTIITTLAIVTLLNIKLSTAGIAAFLMLIGYSVDTDILLSSRVLKVKTGTVTSRIMSAMKTGLTMNMTTLAAVTIALIFSQSDVVTQIMTILFVGLLIDMLNTWVQNAGLLKWYTEKHNYE